MGAGNTLDIFGPLDSQPVANSGAFLSNRNGRNVLNFPDSGNYSAVFMSVLPAQYSYFGISAYVHYTMATGTVGSIKWNGQFERIGSVLDIDGDSFASSTSTGSLTVPGTAGIVATGIIPFGDGAAIDALVPGETYRFKLTRDADTDSASGYAQLLGIELREN